MNGSIRFGYELLLGTEQKQELVKKLVSSNPDNFSSRTQKTFGISDE